MVLVDTKGKILEVAQNIALDFKLKIVTDRAEYEAESANKPFDTAHYIEPQQVLSSAANKARYPSST